MKMGGHFNHKMIRKYHMSDCYKSPRLYVQVHCVCIYLFISIVDQCIVDILISFVRITGRILTPLEVVSNDRVITMVGTPQCFL